MVKIKIKNVWKNFSMKQEASTLKEHFILRFKRKKREKEEIWALKNISFEAKDGDCIGIVGENGSGKTTLLKIIGGILKPTKGTVLVDGKIAPLLTLGLGFDPELTARENVYLYASIMGLNEDEIKLCYDRIVEFAELEPFMNVKLKNFSDGMKVRLGFATAVNVDADILLVDEVLAVGDGAFQKKCLEKFREFKNRGKIIIFVSHGLETVKEYADKAIFLRNGKIESIGDAKKVVEEYSQYLKNKELNNHNTRTLKNAEDIKEISLFNENGKSWVFKSGKNFRAEIKLSSPPDSTLVYMDFFGPKRMRLYSKRAKDKEIVFEIDSLPLPVGEYRVITNAGKIESEPLNIAVFEGKVPKCTKVFSPDFSFNNFFVFGDNCESVLEDLKNGKTIPVFSEFEEASKGCENGAVFRNGKLLTKGKIEEITEVYKEMLVEKYREKLNI